MKMTKAPTVHGSVTCTRAAERPVISSARPAPVAPASRLFRLIFQPNLNVAAAHWLQLERLRRRERQPRCVFARVEGPGRRHAWTSQRVGHIGAGLCLTLRCAATRPTAARGTPGVVEGGLVHAGRGTLAACLGPAHTSGGGLVHIVGGILEDFFSRKCERKSTENRETND